MRRGGILLTLWLVVAGTAIAVGTWALSLVGGEISNRAVSPLSNAAINDGLRADRADDSDTTIGPQTSDPGTTPGAIVHPLNTAGGTINVNCQQGNLAYIVSWSPAQGYRADDDMVRGPATTARMAFEADKSAKVPEISATLRCEQNIPSVVTVTHSDHDGGTPTGTQPGTQSGTGAGAPSSPAATDDHGSGGHGADDGTADDHHRRGSGSGGGGGG
ncbi:MAG TPA: hypothetical protein VFX70_22270 [Mycobacteriales bacterium]|nr:hypothetical protein [Mycobacteriales bacterium]